MSTIEATTALSDVVTRRPDSAAVLEAFGLDYCCGGARSLAEACDTAEIDIEDVLARLGQEAPVEAPADWASLGPAELVDELERTHHTYLGHALARISDLLTKVVDVHAESHPELHDIEATYSELRNDLEPHLLKEEQILFPMIRELYATTDVPTFHCGTLRNPISVMCFEHDRAGELLTQLRAQTSTYTPPSDGCESYQALFAAMAELEADTHLHIHKENNVLFPAVIAEELHRASS